MPIAVAKRIDIHHHYAPPTWLRSEHVVGGLSVAGGHWNDWSPQRVIEEMERCGIEKAMLSITTPGIAFGDIAATRRLARECNEFAASTVAAHPGRFGVFLVLPLPDIEGSLRELAFGLDTLHADGIGLFTNHDSRWLGDPYFAPLFEELDRRRAVVFVHPTNGPCCENMMPGIPDSAIEYGTDTTRAIARMIFSGSSRRYPNVRMIFSHAGGTMPFLNQRFVRIAERDPRYTSVLPDGFLPEARRFYYDTAQAAHPAAMASLMEIIPLSQVVFGTDYPFMTLAENVAGLEDCGIFTSSQLVAIGRSNALALIRT